jgi:hypothetical protein
VGKDKSTEPSGYLGDNGSKPDVIEKLTTEFVNGKVLEAVVGKVAGRVIGIGLGVLDPTMLGTNDTTQPPSAWKDTGKSLSGVGGHDPDVSRHERDSFISDRHR